MYLGCRAKMGQRYWRGGCQKGGGCRLLPQRAARASPTRQARCPCPLISWHALCIRGWVKGDVMGILNRLKNIFLLTIAFLGLFGMVLATDVQADTTAPAAAQPVTEAAAPAACDAAPDALAGGAAVTLAALDGEVPLMDTPVSNVARFPVPTGTAVRIVTSAALPDGCWYLVELADASQGWVPATALTR